MEIKIYTDGACIGNPGPGGWAAIIMSEKEEKKGFAAWIDKRLPVFTFINHNLRDYPTPKNLNYFWNFVKFRNNINNIRLSNFSCNFK